MLRNVLSYTETSFLTGSKIFLYKYILKGAQPFFVLTPARHSDCTPLIFPFSLELDFWPVLSHSCAQYKVCLMSNIWRVTVFLSGSIPAVPLPKPINTLCSSWCQQNQLQWSRIAQKIYQHCYYPKGFTLEIIFQYCNTLINFGTLHLVILWKAGKFCSSTKHLVCYSSSSNLK